MDRGALCATVHGVRNSQIGLSVLFNILEKGMATHSSILAWRIPWTERSLVGYSLWDLEELDMTE